MTAAPAPPYNEGMKVVELRELRLKESTIHYLKEFTALAVLEARERRSEAEVVVTVEHKAMGPPDVGVRVLRPLDWPLLPVVHALRDYFLDMQKSGRLP